MLLFCLIAFPLTGFFSGRIFAKLSLEPEIDELNRSLQSAGTPKEFESHVAIKNDLNRLGEATKDLRRYLQTIKDLHTQASALSVSIRGTSARPFPKYTESLSGEDYGYDIAKTIEKLRLLCDSNSSKNAPNAGEGESNTTTNVSEGRTHSQPSAWPKGMILNSEKIGANSPSMQQSEQSSTFEERLIQIVKIEFLRNSGVDIDQDPLGPKVKQDILEQSESLRCQLQSKETRLVIPYAAVVDNKAIDLDVLIKPTDFPATQLEETTSSLPETSSAIYSVILMTFGEHKLGVVKLLKTRLNLDLMEAKKLVERCPVVIASGLTEDDAGDLVMEINNAGGQAEYE